METTNLNEQPEQIQTEPKQLMEQVQQPEQTAAPKKKGPKWGLILGIGIPVIIVAVVASIFISSAVKKNNLYEDAISALKDGDIDDAVAIHEELGDYKDLEKRIVSAASSEVEDYLDDDKYSKAIKILKYVADYEDAVADITDQFDEYVADLMEDGNYYTAISLFNELKKYENVQSVVAENITAYVVDLIEKEDYYYAQNIYRELQYNEFDVAAITDAYYTKAMALMEEENYDAARELLWMIEDVKDVTEELQQIEEAKELAQALEDLQYYLDWGYYSWAEDIVKSFEGDNTPLLELYMQYCGDDTVLDALESALNERVEWGNAGNHTNQEIQDMLDMEYSYLEEYCNKPFYDDTLGELIGRYIELIDDQENELYWYDYGYYEKYEFDYYWTMINAERYEILTQLYEQYGFASNNETLKENFLNKENTAEYAEICKMISEDLAYQLWHGYIETDENGNYYVRYTNNTGMTFEVTILNELTDYGDTVYYSGETYFEQILPGEEVMVMINAENWNENVSYWAIEWTLGTIYDLEG